MARALVTLVALSMLASCGAKDGDLMAPQEAARLLRLACGVSFAEDPVVISSTSAKPTASATVALPSSEAAAALKALRDNPALHSRGQSQTRFSYETYPEARPAAACELDTSLQVLYFSHAE